MAKVTNYLICKRNINNKTMSQPGEWEVVGRGVTNRDKSLLIQVSGYLNSFVSRREIELKPANSPDM